MSETRARRTTRRTLKRISVGLVGAAVAVIAVLVHQAALSPPPSFSEVLRGTHGAAPTGANGGVTEVAGAVSQADGVLPDGATVFDERYPGVARLRPDLLAALRKAATAAARDGVTVRVKSGWRSPEYQNQLLREAVSEYGSEAQAARWVATAHTSPHVSGEAVDLGDSDATAWLSRHGAGYGLCQIYRNEPWHYELRPSAVEDGCPRMYADPTRDPRLQR